MIEAPDGFETGSECDLRNGKKSVAEELFRQLYPVLLNHGNGGHAEMLVE